MNLYFVRHGMAEDRANWDPARDHLRPLTPDGAARLGKSVRVMKALGLKPEAILTSPLTRARQTADILGEGLGRPVVEDEVLADFSVSGLGSLLDRYPRVDSLMLVGHEPDFSIVVGMITGGGQIEVKKGSLIRVDLVSTHPPRGTLIWNIPPRLLALCAPT